MNKYIVLYLFIFLSLNNNKEQRLYDFRTAAHVEIVNGMVRK